VKCKIYLLFLLSFAQTAVARFITLALGGDNHG
jgi:hypothetical protein